MSPASLNAADTACEEFTDDWEDLYPAMIKSWRDMWYDFIPFLEFPAELRKIVLECQPGLAPPCSGGFRGSTQNGACR